MDWKLYADDAEFLKGIGIDAGAHAPDASSYQPITRLIGDWRAALQAREPLVKKLDRLTDLVLFADSERKRLTSVAYGNALAYLFRTTEPLTPRQHHVLTDATVHAFTYDTTDAPVITPRDVCDIYRRLCPDAYRVRFGDIL